MGNSIGTKRVKCIRFGCENFATRIGSFEPAQLQRLARKLTFVKLRNYL